MGISTGVVLILIGILAAASLIIKKKPDAKELIDKLVPFQGWIGFISCLWGVWIVISSFLIYLPIFLLGANVFAFILFPLVLASGVLQIAIGFILGYGLINKFALSKADENVKKKAEEMLQKLVSMQVTLGIISIIVGLFNITFEVLYWIF